MSSIGTINPIQSTPDGLIKSLESFPWEVIVMPPEEQRKF